ncbi:MAG: hypothetical protein V1656_00005 [Candidatus Jorgensenbacteria bacterium]
MRIKVWLILFGILVLLAAAYAATLVLGFPKAEAPASETATSTFRGPVGLPHVNGPGGPPPGGN